MAITTALADPKIKLIPLGSGRPSPASQLLPEVMGSIEKLCHDMWPEIPVLPVMDPWTGDSVHLCRAGIPTFGISGTFSDESGNAHGANERLATDVFDESVEFLYRLLKSMTGAVSTHS